LPHSAAENDIHQRLEIEPAGKFTSSNAFRDAGRLILALKEAYRKHGSNTQQMKIADVVLINVDSPKISWRMAVIEYVNR